MRILLLAQFYPPILGGEERHVRNLAISLAARGHDVHVGCLEVGAEPERTGGVTVHALPNIGVHMPALYRKADRPLALPLPDPLTTRALRTLVAQVRPDVVHAHNWIINAYLPLKAARRLPLVYSLHDYSHICPTKRLVYRGEDCTGPGLAKCFECTSDWYGTGRGPVIQAAVRSGRPVRNRIVDLVTPVARYVGTANRLDEQRLRWEVVPNFVPDSLRSLPELPRHPDLPSGDYLFFAGDLSAQKGVPTLLAAYDRLPTGARPELLLVGSPVDELGALPEGARVEHSWPHDRVISGFQHALAAVLPSAWPEPCPTTVLEAMAIGTPLVTTHEGGIAEMVVPDKSALVVPAKDVGATATALERVIADEELRSRLVQAARIDVEPFLLSRVTDRLEELYSSLVCEYA